MTITPRSLLAVAAGVCAVLVLVGSGVAAAATLLAIAALLLAVAAL